MLLLMHAALNTSHGCALGMSERVDKVSSHSSISFTGVVPQKMACKQDRTNVSLNQGFSSRTASMRSCDLNLKRGINPSQAVQISQTFVIKCARLKLALKEHRISLTKHLLGLLKVGLFSLCVIAPTQC